MNAQRTTPPEGGVGKGLAGHNTFGSNCNPADLLLQRLEAVRQTGPDAWLARCPAHDDRSPSLSIKQAGDRLLVHCFTGCAADSVMAAVGLTLADLFDKPLAHHLPPASRRERVRYGQAMDALRVLAHEALVVQIAAETLAGCDERLALAVERIRRAREVALC